METSNYIVRCIMENAGTNFLGVWPILGNKNAAISTSMFSTQLHGNAILNSCPLKAIKHSLAILLYVQCNLIHHKRLTTHSVTKLLMAFLIQN